MQVVWFVINQFTMIVYVVSLPFIICFGWQRAYVDTGVFYLGVSVEGLIRDVKFHEQSQEHMELLSDLSGFGVVFLKRESGSFSGNIQKRQTKPVRSSSGFGVVLWKRKKLSFQCTSRSTPEPVFDLSGIIAGFLVKHVLFSYVKPCRKTTTPILVPSSLFGL